MKLTQSTTFTLRLSRIIAPPQVTGSKEVGKAAKRQMEEAGCRVVLFHAWTLLNIGVLNDRDHRKLVVIDGSEAFVGGHCIVDSWLGKAQDKEHFADISVRLRGPIVHSVQSAFSENWGGETGGCSSATMCFRPWNLQATC